MSYLLFTLRDGFTITASFVVKHDVKRALERDYGLSHGTVRLTTPNTIIRNEQLSVCLRLLPPGPPPCLCLAAWLPA